MAVTVFSFPPDKGNVGTAAYLNVFGSIFRVLRVRARGAAACLLLCPRGVSDSIWQLAHVAGAARGDEPHIVRCPSSAGVPVTDARASARRT